MDDPRAHRAWLAAFDGFEEYDRLGCRRALIGANMGLKRHAGERLPAFDSELGGGGLGNCEEILFGSGTLVEAGYRIEFADGAGSRASFWFAAAKSREFSRSRKGTWMLQCIFMSPLVS